MDQRQQRPRVQDQKATLGLPRQAQRSGSAQTASVPARKALLGSLLLDASRFSRTTSKIIQLSPANLTQPGNFDALNVRRMQCKDALNTDAVRDFPHREASIVAAATSCNHHTFEHLYALLVPFDDTLVDLYGCLLYTSPSPRD